MAGLRLAESVVARPDTGRLVGLYDTNTQLLEATLPLQAARRTERWEDLLDLKDLDVVLVATPDNQHFDIVTQSLSAGVHVFCEKPIVTKRQELNSVYDNLLSTRLALGTNTILRTAERYARLRKMLRNQELGEIATFSAAYVYGRVHKIQQGWRGSYPEYSPTLGGGIHMLDLINFLLESRPTSVFAKRSNRAARALSLNFYDTATALLTYPDGLVGTLSSVFASAHPHHHFLRIEGTKATFENRPNDTSQLWSFSQDSTHVDTSGRVPDKGIVLQSFLRFVRDGTAPIVSANEAINTLSAAIAIEESMESGREVFIPYYDDVS